MYIFESLVKMIGDNVDQVSAMWTIITTRDNQLDIKPKPFYWNKIKGNLLNIRDALIWKFGRPENED